MGEALKSRAKAALLGSLVADAASMPLHWIYEHSELDGLLADKFKQVTPEFFDPPANKFYCYNLGHLSPYGDEEYAVLQYAASHEDVDGPGLTKALYDFFKAYPGRLNTAAQKMVANLDAGKAFPHAGAEGDVQAHALFKVPPLVAKYAGRPELLDRVEAAVRTQQDSDGAVAYGRAAAQILERVVLGSTITDVLAWAQLEGNLAEDVRAAVVSALADTSRPVREALHGFGLACAMPGSFQGALYVAATAGGYVEGVRANIKAGGDNCARACLLGALLAAAEGQVHLEWAGQTALMAEFGRLADAVVAGLPTDAAAPAPVAVPAAAPAPASAPAAEADAVVDVLAGEPETAEEALPAAAEAPAPAAAEPTPAAEEPAPPPPAAKEPAPEAEALAAEEAPAEAPAPAPAVEEPAPAPLAAPVAAPVPQPASVPVPVPQPAAALPQQVAPQSVLGQQQSAVPVTALAPAQQLGVAALHVAPPAPAPAPAMVPQAAAPAPIPPLLQVPGGGLVVNPALLTNPAQLQQTLIYLQQTNPPLALQVHTQVQAILQQQQQQRMGILPQQPNLLAAQQLQAQQLAAQQLAAQQLQAQQLAAAAAARPALVPQAARPAPKRETSPRSSARPQRARKRSKRLDEYEELPESDDEA